MRKLLLAFLGVAGVLSIACDNRTIPLPERASGTMSVAASVRAQSPHYRLLGTLAPAGGRRADSSHAFHDGAFVNGQ